MKKNRLAILALATVILTVVTSGNALAYSFSNVEWSTYCDASISYTSTTSGHPTLNGGDYLTWQNTFVNNNPGIQIRPELWSFTDTPSQQNADQVGEPLSYHCAWCPDGSNPPVTNPTGEHTISIYHKYRCINHPWSWLFGDLIAQGYHELNYNYAG